MITEVHGNLFGAPPHVALAHCVSVDLRMGKGIALLFRERFGNIAALQEQKPTIGSTLVLQHPARPGPIFYLVTKARATGKPTYETMALALRSLRKAMELVGVHELAIPHIGCGLDRLEWPRVRGLLQSVFAGTGVQITAYIND